MVIATGILIIIVLAITGIFIVPGMKPKISQTLPNQKKNFFGRDKDVKDLLEIVDFSNDSFRFINIIGSPGFGKSALAISVGNEMLMRGTEVYYTDLMDYPNTHFKQVLAERILIEENDMEVAVTFESLIRWGKKRRWSNNLIILDNCDECIKDQKEAFQDAIEKILQYSGSNLKIMTTSREVLWHSDTHFVHKVHPIGTKSACQLLEYRNPSLLKESEKIIIANLTGEVPLALQIVGALLSHKINSATEIIESLKRQPIPTLSPNELRSSMQLDASISLSYNNLDANIQKVGRYLAYFTGSFDQFTGVNVLHPLTKSHGISQVYLSLKILAQLSLLEFDEKSGRFHYHKLIRDYFYTRSALIEFVEYMYGLRLFYSHELCSMASKFRTSPKEALHKLDLDRHHIQQLIVDFALYIKRFDLKLSTCFLTAVKTKYLKCRFALPDIIRGVKVLTLSFQDSVITIISSKKITKLINLTQEFKIYVELAIELANLLQESGENEEALQLTKLSLVVVDLMCLIPDTDESCRTFYSHILTYEDKFDAKTAKLYHIQFLERSKESQINCKSTAVSVCNYGLIAVSYLKLKNFNQTKFFFEKALADERTTYSLFDRIYMLLWLRANFRDAVNIVQVENDLMELYDSVLNLTSSELYKYNYEVENYRDFLSSSGEQDKAFSIQERWIQAMEEIGVDSKQEQIKLAAGTANSLYLAGQYERSIEVVKHALTVIENDSLIVEYILLTIIKGKITYMVNNLTESEAAFCSAMENILANNLTATLYGVYSEVCWNLFLLSNPEYIHVCYTRKFINHVEFYIEVFFFILLKSPFDRVPQKPTKKSKVVDAPVEYFTSISQQSSKKDLVIEDKGLLFVFKRDITRVFRFYAGYLFKFLWEFCRIALELDSPRIFINFMSILIRFVFLKLLLHAVRYLIWRCFDFFFGIIYLVIILLLHCWCTFI